MNIQSPYVSIRLGRGQCNSTMPDVFSSFHTFPIIWAARAKGGRWGAYSSQIILFEASAAVNAASDAFCPGRTMNFLDAWIWGGGFPVPSLSMSAGIVHDTPSLNIYLRKFSSFGFAFLEIQSELERGGKLFRTVPNAFPPKKRYFLFGAGTTAFHFSSRQQLWIIFALIISRFLFFPSKEKGEIPCFCART